MTTNIELTKSELSELKELTGEVDLAVAQRRAVREYIRYAKRMRLKALAGTDTMQLAEHGKSFEFWLDQSEDVYTAEDGDPV